MDAILLSCQGRIKVQSKDRASYVAVDMVPGVSSFSSAPGLLRPFSPIDRLCPPRRPPSQRKLRSLLAGRTPPVGSLFGTLPGMIFALSNQFLCQFRQLSPSSQGLKQSMGFFIHSRVGIFHDPNILPSST